MQSAHFLLGGRLVSTHKTIAADSAAGVKADDVTKRSVMTHPVVFVAVFTLIGLLFAGQEWLHLHHMSGYRISAALVFGSWGAQYFIWGIIAWVLWRLFRPFIERASAVQILTIVFPVSLITCWIQEMIWVIFFPNIPVDRPPVHYWQSVLANFRGDLVESMVIFWGAFFFFRGFGYYQQFREKETVAAQLEAQLANAQIAALRMQLNPHFLFNTMNSISSLMRSDIDAADSMLEQMSSLLRMTLERRDVQLISLHDEIEFIETYLAMQDKRYMGRIIRTLAVDPELHDALVPAMILQPIVENAFAHGLSKVGRGGELSIEVFRDSENICARVINSGLGLTASLDDPHIGHGVGLANVKNRLHLHYGDDCSFSIVEIDPSHVQVFVAFPLQLSPSALETVTRFGV
jgi:two-component system, LytTR family, sensor kinase